MNSGLLLQRFFPRAASGSAGPAAATAGLVQYASQTVRMFGGRGQNRSARWAPRGCFHGMISEAGRWGSDCPSSGTVQRCKPAGLLAFGLVHSVPESDGTERRRGRYRVFGRSVVLCNCQRAVAVIVSNDLPKRSRSIRSGGHTWYGRCCGRWLRKRLTACRFIHTFHRCRSETPSAACRFSGNHNNCHKSK